MKKLSKDEQGVKTLTVDAAAMTVVCQGTVLDGEKGKADSVRYQLSNIVLDFSGVSEEELLRLCGREVLTWVQGQWNKSQQAARFKPDLWERVWNVKAEVIDATRKARTVDPFAAAMAGATSFTPEQKAALLKALGATS